MFTGIITATGTVKRVEKTGDRRMTVACGDFARDAAIGASISCGGACLTVIEKDSGSFVVQVSAETLARTTLGGWEEDTRINLERALKVGDELGGHFVSGHVDGLGVVEKIEKSGESSVLHFSIPPRHCEEAEPTRQSSPAMSTGTVGLPRSLRSLAMTHKGELIRFIAPKGSVTLDGVSLTVNDVTDETFTVNIIPHTQQSTTLGKLKAGDKVNLEIDLVARYLARLTGR